MRVLKREKATTSKTTSGKLPDTAELTKFRESLDDEVVTALPI